MRIQYDRIIEIIQIIQIIIIGWIIIIILAFVRLTPLILFRLLGIKCVCDADSLFKLPRAFRVGTRKWQKAVEACLCQAIADADGD